MYSIIEISKYFLSYRREYYEFFKNIACFKKDNIYLIWRAIIRKFILSIEFVPELLKFWSLFSTFLSFLYPYFNLFYNQTSVKASCKILYTKVFKGTYFIKKTKVGMKNYLFVSHKTKHTSSARFLLLS